MVNLIPLKQLTQKGLNMKTLNAMLTAAALILTAGIAQADVRPDHIPGLLKSGEINTRAQLLSTPNWIIPTANWFMKLNCATARASSGMSTWMLKPLKCCKTNKILKLHV